MTRDPNSYIAASAEHLAETLTKKNSDYAPTGEFSNFEKAAGMVGGGMDALSVMLVQVGIKVTRIESLRQNVDGPANFESLSDSLLDLAGYAIIAHAWLTSHRNEPDFKEQKLEATDFIEDRETIRNALSEECSHVWNYVGGYESVCAKCPEVRHG